MNIIVKKSKIHNKGVFAARDFMRGEIVLKWRPKELNKTEIKKLSAKQQNYLEKVGNKYYLMRAPEKYVNHSCEANTKVKNFCDVASRAIKKGEEITSNYLSTSAVEFACQCGAKNCVSKSNA